MRYTTERKQWSNKANTNAGRKQNSILNCLRGSGDCSRCFFLLPDYCPVNEARKILRELDAAQGLIAAQHQRNA